MADWFRNLTGFVEKPGLEDDVKSRLRIDGTKLTCIASGATYECGVFRTPSLEELRAEGRAKLENLGASLCGKAGVTIVFGDVAEHHRKTENKYALFQVASQLNCLEFPDSNVTPEQGITGYQSDRTQGPCCAIACGAGTVYRHYFVPVEDASGQAREGQTADCQIECLRDIARLLENDKHKYLTVKNGYTMAGNEGLRALGDRLKNTADRERLLGLLRVGVQSDVQVTSSKWGNEMLNQPDQLVTQVFGSACSVSYSGNGADLWEPIARLILEASYEATLWAGVINAIDHKGKGGSRKVFLTALGGGVFGNRMEWIQDAIEQALERVCLKHALALQIYIVTYAPPVDKCIANLVTKHGCEQAEVGGECSRKTRDCMEFARWCNVL